MPFAQWGYPHKGDAEFRAAYPADFISEAIDQTRGWFNSLLWVSTLLFPEREKPIPFRTLHRARPRLRPRRQEGIQEQGQLHAARGDPRPRAARVRGGRERGREGRAAARRSAHRARGVRRARPVGRVGAGGRVSLRRRDGPAAARRQAGEASAARDAAPRERSRAARRPGGAARPRHARRGRAAPRPGHARLPRGPRRRPRRAQTRSAGSSTLRTRRGTRPAIRSPACERFSGSCR